MEPVILPFKAGILGLLPTGRLGKMSEGPTSMDKTTEVTVHSADSVLQGVSEI